MNASSAPQLILFDLDGTLADTLADLAACCNEALKTHQLPIHPQSSYRQMVGRGARVLLQKALPEDRQIQLDEVLQTFLTIYQQKTFIHTKLYAGTHEVLDQLATDNCPTGVLSNKPHAACERFANHLLSDWPWLEVLGHKPSFAPKPDPASALDLCHRHGFSPSEVWYVGDSDVDMQTAKNAGFFAIGAAWGFRGAQELHEHGADVVLAAPLALLDFYKKMH